MTVEFDPSKDRRNVQSRGLSLSLVDEFDWLAASYAVSKAQNNDTSTRFVAIGPIGLLIFVVVFTIGARGVRVISLRRANDRERKRWSSRTRS